MAYNWHISKKESRKMYNHKWRRKNKPLYMSDVGMVFESEMNDSDIIRAGDYVEAGPYASLPQGGIVLGVIRDMYDRDACVKILTKDGVIDYIQASNIFLHEQSGSQASSLKDIGYEMKEDYDGYCYYYNPETKDVVLPWEDR